MLRFRFIAFIFLTISSSVWAQISVTKYSNEFLQLGVGARQLGMANTGVSLVNDATAGYWNPAGLASLQHKYDVSLMHSEYFAGIAKYDYLGFAHKLDSNSSIGFSALRFGVDDIPNTLDLIDPQTQGINYDRIKKFSASDYAFLVSFAQKASFLKGLQWGANFKVIYRSVGPFATAWGLGLDAGAQYTYKKWQLGAMFRDIAGTYNIWSFNTETFATTFLQTNNEIPQNSTELTLPSIGLGVSRTFNFKKDFSFTPVLDLMNYLDGARNTLLKNSVASVDPRMGIEIGYKNLVFLRGGVGNFQKITQIDRTNSWSSQPNFGLGVKIKMVQIDYALTNIGNVSEVLYSNVFSLKFSLL